jgi:hypothetical protein
MERKLEVAREIEGGVSAKTNELHTNILMII